MNKKDEQIVAFIFKRSGKDQLKESELYLILSMDLKWCSPKSAKEYIAHLISLDLLQKEDDGVSPAFDVQGVVIPLGFHPQQEDFLFNGAKQPTDPLPKTAFEHCIERLQKYAALDRTTIEKEVTVIMEEKQILAEAAIALFSSYHKVDVSDLLSALRKELLRENKGL